MLVSCSSLINAGRQQVSRLKSQADIEQKNTINRLKTKATRHLKTLPISKDLQLTLLPQTQLQGTRSFQQPWLSISIELVLPRRSCTSTQIQKSHHSTVFGLIKSGTVGNTLKMGKALNRRGKYSHCTRAQKQGRNKPAKKK